MAFLSHSCTTTLPPLISATRASPRSSKSIASRTAAVAALSAASRESRLSQSSSILRCNSFTAATLRPAQFPELFPYLGDLGLITSCLTSVASDSDHPDQLSQPVEVGGVAGVQ